MSALARFTALIRKPWVPWAIAMLCLVFAAYAVQQSIRASDEAKQATVQLDKESTERRDVACIGSESQHAQEIRDLKRTYAILKDPPKVYDELLKNPLVLASFRDTILAAVNDEDVLGIFVSPFCDDPDIGLPEPDPVVPATPSYVSDLLPGINKQIVKQQAVTVEDAKKQAEKQQQR